MRTESKQKRRSTAEFTSKLLESAIAMYPRPHTIIMTRPAILVSAKTLEVT